MLTAEHMVAMHLQLEEFAMLGSCRGSTEGDVPQIHRGQL